jgi:hypothetical protein
MRLSAAVVCLVGLASCAAPVAEDYRWTLDCPKSVERGAGFQFTVHAAHGQSPNTTDLPYRFEITWPAGAGSALRQGGVTGTPSKAHARMVPGPATLVILVGEVRVCEAAFDIH